MTLFTIFSRLPDHASCIEHLEDIRWGDVSRCPHCRSAHVARQADGTRVGRWNCHACPAGFTVLPSTIFEKPRLPRQQWCLASSLMRNAKTSLSRCQLGRDVDLNQRSAWSLQHRIRAARARDADALLHGLIEADETSSGGKPRKFNKNKKVPLPQIHAAGAPARRRSSGQLNAAATPTPALLPI